jgi:DNA-binding IclR family transcriptional regulator
MPLVVPREDSPPEMRILNAIYSGQLFEGRTNYAEELGMTKPEFTRALRSLRTSGAIHVGPGGRYRLSFNTSNFPDITSR